MPNLSVVARRDVSLNRKPGFRSGSAPGLGYLLREAYRAFSRELDRRLDAHSITHSQWVLMWFLRRAGSLTPLELSRAVGIKKASATGVIESLRVRGFLVAERDQQDGRKMNLSLTTYGVDAMEEMSECVWQANQQVHAGFSKQDLETLQILLQRIAKNASQGQPMPE